MQLSRKSSLRGALTAVTAALLGSGGHAASGDRLESSILLYSEVDRVQVAEGIISLTHPLKGGQLLSGRLTLDGLTGASPNGATRSSHIQTFTRPSGDGSYSTAPGELPLDNTFKDTRYSFDGSLTQPLGRLSHLILGAHASTEHDYTSLGANVGLTRDFNRKNTTLSASGAYSHDQVRPVGGAPDPLTELAPPGENDDGQEFEDGEDGRGGTGHGRGKDVFDGVVGVTQVLDRKTLLRLNYSFSHASGYLNDPYKLLSVVQPRSATDPGEPVTYLYEGRPDNRTKQAFYGQVRRYLAGQTVDLSYRYFWDDWGITSNTIDLYYHLPISAGHALQPHFRWYRQTAADFYRSFLVDGSPQPAYASADYRLAAFHAITVGLEYFFPFSDNVDFSVGFEYYRQSGDLSPPSSLGVLSRYDPFPNMDALMLRVGFSRGL